MKFGQNPTRRRCSLNKSFMDAWMDGQTHDRQQTKCDHKSSPCHYVTSELKMSHTENEGPNRTALLHSLTLIFCVHLQNLWKLNIHVY